MAAERHIDTREFKWGNKTLAVKFPAAYRVDWICPREIKATRSEEDIINQTLDHPIGSFPLEAVVKPGDNVAIIVNDMTRLWQKPQLLLDHILARLQRAGTRDQDIAIIVATGMHRADSDEHLRKIVGADNYGRLSVFDHDCRDPDRLVSVGRSPAGAPMLLNRTVVEADCVIAVGGIALHGVAGFSGGCKSVLPGVAGYETIQQFHRLAFDDEFNLKPAVKPGSVEGNPGIPMMQAAARVAGVDFILNVIVGPHGRYLDAVAGNLIEAHRVGCRLARDYFLIPCPHKASLVVGSVGGYPRDIEMYQSIKALGNCAVIAAQGGTIILLSQCAQGIGSDEWLDWMQLDDRRAIIQKLSRAFSFAGFVALKTLTITSTHRVILVSSLLPEAVRQLHMEPAGSLEEALEIAGHDLPHDASVLAMPLAGSTTPYIEGD
jgi:nickel-dependent lactate racemase